MVYGLKAPSFDPLIYLKYNRKVQLPMLLIELKRTLVKYL